MSLLVDNDLIQSHDGGTDLLVANSTDETFITVCL